jgi:hypothetical protein
MKLCSGICYASEDIVMGVIRVELKELVLLCNSGIVKVFGLAGRDLLFQLNLTVTFVMRNINF